MATPRSASDLDKKYIEKLTSETIDGPVVSPTNDAKVDRYDYKPGAVLQFSGVVLDCAHR